MKNKIKKFGFLALMLAISSTRLPTAQAHEGEEHGELDTKETAALMKQVGIDQKMNSQVPLTAVFKDEKGMPVTLARYLGENPVMLTLISYTCTQVCTAEAETMQATLQDLPFTVGKDFDVVVCTIDPRETTAMALAHKEENTANYKKGSKGFSRKGSEAGWHYLTGSEASIKALAKSIGYRYALNPETKEYVHPDGLVLLTPQGHVSRYFYNLNYPVRDVKFGLIEASQRKIGTPLDYLAMTCFHYNPTTGKYDFAITALLQICGIATVLGMALGVGLMLRAEKKRGAANLKTPNVQSA